MNNLKTASIYLQVIADIITSKDYFKLDDDTIKNMTKALENREIIEKKLKKHNTTDDLVYKAAVRINQLVVDLKDPRFENIIKTFVEDINRKFELSIDYRVLYYDSTPGKLPKQRPCRYEAHYRISEDSRTEYVNIVAYSAQEATKQFEAYMKKCGYYNNIFYHSTEARYEGPLYRYEPDGAIFGANWF